VVGVDRAFGLQEAERDPVLGRAAAIGAIVHEAALDAEQLGDCQPVPRE
jgi:hypothetical protein